MATVRSDEVSPCRHEKGRISALCAVLDIQRSVGSGFSGRFKRGSAQPWIFMPNLHHINLVDRSSSNVISPLA
jgi:hypothetical protein